MSNISDLVRPEVLSLIPYQSARNEYAGGSGISLDANENPDEPYGQSSRGLNRYPEPQPRLLRQKIAEIYNVSPHQLLLTRGIDEGIDLLIRTFCYPNQDTITIIKPTFAYYEVSATIQSAKTISVTSIDDIRENTKIIFLCTPNNPTGEIISLMKIKAMCERFAHQAIIAVDEAYIEFSCVESASTLLNQCENLVVMRTLSKAYGLAGIRIGAVLASEKIITWLRNVQPPYPIPTPCVIAAMNALSPVGLYYAQKKIEQIKRERVMLFNALSQSAMIKKVYSSEGNFLLFIAQNADDLYDRLKMQGIVIRKRTQDIPNALRVSIGTPEENRLLLSALGVFEEKRNEFPSAQRTRKTNETEIMCDVIFDQQGNYTINTCIPFFDHMLEQLSRHSGISLCVKAMGDLNVDLHHTIEDVAITLGLCLKDALGNKAGLSRYGFVLPMDESLAQVCIDLSGRGYCAFEATFLSMFVGNFPVEMVKHFFQTLSINMEAAVHIKVSGENTHHMIEAIFKGFARAMRQAMMNEGACLPTTKGVLS